MMLSNFNNEFKQNIRNKDVDGARNTIIRELGLILAENKQDFVNLLRESGVKATMQDSELDLIDLYVKNIPNNKKLMLGTSLLVNQKNKKLSADGTTQISDSNVKVGYEVLKSCFDGEQFSYAADPITAIAEAAGKIGEAQGKKATARADMYKTFQDARNKKLYGAQELAGKQTEAKTSLMQSILNYKTAKAQSGGKTNNTPIILAVSAVVVVGIIIAIVVKRRNQ